MNAAQFREHSNREYLKGLRDPQRPMRNRVSVLRQQGHPESDAAANRLETALDRINEVWSERSWTVVRDTCPQTGRERAAA